MLKHRSIVLLLAMFLAIALTVLTIVLRMPLRLTQQELAADQSVKVWVQLLRSSFAVYHNRTGLAEVSSATLQSEGLIFASDKFGHIPKANLRLVGKSLEIAFLEMPNGTFVLTYLDFAPEIVLGDNVAAELYYGKQEAIIRSNQAAAKSPKEFSGMDYLIGPDWVIAITDSSSGAEITKVQPFRIK